MGIRALIESVMIDKIEDQGSFYKNLTAFESEGFVSKSQRSVLEPVLEAGHATIHRSFNPSREDIVTCLDVAEGIIEAIYINEDRAAALSRKVPPRKPVKR